MFVEVEEIIVKDLSYTIIQIVDDLVIIEVEAKVRVKFNVPTDDENYMYYDSDDKSYQYYDTNYEHLKRNFILHYSINGNL
jgi:hypothetical protein